MSKRKLAQSKRVTKPTGKTKAHDAKLLTKAAIESREGATLAELLAEQGVKPAAEVIRSAKAKIAENLTKPNGPGVVEEFAAAKREMADIPVPLTLGQACLLIGGNVDPQNFTTTAFAAIARDVETLSDLAEHESEESGFYGWLMLQQLANRARFAGEVAALLEAAEPGGAS